MKHLLLSCAAAAFLFTAADAEAKNDKGKGGKDWKHSEREYDRDDRRWRDDDRVLMQLHGPDIEMVRVHMQPYYVKKCPPGLAKKHNGCRPPGHARGYSVGSPYNGPYWDVPRDIFGYLPPAPYGSRYIWVDRDILLISEATKKVLDAVVILSGL